MLKPFLAACLAGYLVFAGAALMAASGDAANGERLAHGCKCHKNELNGRAEAELVKSLQAYKSGARTHAFMTKKARSLSDQDIQDLAAWFASR
ncbi:c-type cytochrome [Desulfocurvus sp. DL9XJH121]